MKKFLVCLTVFAVGLASPAVAFAVQDSTPIQVEDSTPSTADAGGEEPPPIADDEAGGLFVVLGDFVGDYVGPTEKTETPIPPTKPAARAGKHSSVDRPCYKFDDGSGASGLADEKAPELSQQERFALGQATDAELLDAVNGSRRVARAAAQNVDAIFRIFEREAALAKPTTGVVPGSGAGQCRIEYFCSAERVDDVVSGHIDSEPDGTYAEYVNDVALVLDDSTADIRRVESNPPADGAAAPQIPAPSSPESQKSLASALAERGLDTRPGELFMPVFNFCRQGEGGTIEIEGAHAVSFGWTRLDEEFDIPGSSQLVLDGVKRQLLGELPQMRTIPPIDEGVTIVKFPMWLWLDEPFPGAAFEQVSAGNHIRMRARATLEHVVWKLGDTEIICELDDMQEFVVGAGVSPADKPPCNHTFLELVDYTMTAEAVYRLEQQLSYRDAPSDVWPDAPWVPHPIEDVVSVTSTTGPMSVEEIYSFNTPINGVGDDG